LNAIIFDGTHARLVTDRPIPTPAADECLVRVELAAVCSTDHEILHGYRPDFRGVMGHEFVGVVCGDNGEGGALAGRRVVGEINLSCGACLYCRSERPHHCSARQTLGINNKDGSFAEYLTLPAANLHAVPDDLPCEQAIYTEPLAAALRITEQVAFPVGAPVAILGDGRLALMVCQALASSVAVALTVFGRHPEKLERFAPYAVTSCEAEHEPAGSFEVVIDATGSPHSLPTALRLTRSEGTLVIKSTYAGHAQIDMSEVVVREIRIQGSRCGSFKPALELLRSNLLNLPPLELFAPKDFERAFTSNAFKAGLDWRGREG
jgi:threonine dehydrogenase-like Zn-dependent dehydrogenase